MSCGDGLRVSNSVCAEVLLLWAHWGGQDSTVQNPVLNLLWLGGALACSTLSERP